LKRGRDAARRGSVLAVLLAALIGCRDAPSVPPAKGRPTASPAAAVARAPRTTDGAIAIGNLDAQLAGIDRLALGRPLALPERASQAELLTQRGQILGRISDYERAETIAEVLVRDVRDDGRAWLARARSRATFHRFEDALADLTEAERLGLDATTLDGVRVGILQGTGREQDALVLRQRQAAARPGILTLGGEATAQAALGRLDEAERLFAAAVASYRDVSPFPVAWIEFQRGLMWMRENELERARTWLAAAQARLPQYAQAAGHLAEVEAALGRVDRAVALLEPLAATVEDPDYAAQLARILGEAGRAEEARPWRERAVARYDELIAKHPEAFADHGAELYLAAGADPARALELAERNLKVRPTVRAWELVMRAAGAAGNAARACAAAAGARDAGYLYASARTAIAEVLRGCQMSRSMPTGQ
jgi:tetratricopeptide (TPR) repeat protein